MLDLARAVAVSERTLVRRFGVAIGQTPLGYLQGVRLEAARALLEIGDMTVQSVAVQVGYSDVSSFSRLFRQEVGLTPGSYRRRFRSPVRGGAAATSGRFGSDARAAC
jgi:transcriptional regulator GlxA family with amidase domain